ncbi:uncharacterized protein TNIN_417871 [Trichonephila inaurata madagascariensis]|uniref:Uncharacterized protein n=1 Tax=Trichonephila inaurata madagascariensis TaxID=2747483 RepID=A0A8X6XQY1_9ARAC|nr:uncharacterized protein TNIN_417871 [Trichonephila inaurata madagascariensis]
MEYVMGSFFTKDELPQYCYTLYSLWGNPDKKRERIPKGSIMRFHFYLNASRRGGPNPTTGEWIPAFNTPTTPSLQIAIHSPYFLPSPYNDGSTFSGGRSYELRVLMEETHLLQSPYQTNCTDYLKTWRENGGTGPINQMTYVLEEGYKNSGGIIVSRRLLLPNVAVFASLLDIPDGGGHPEVVPYLPGNTFYYHLQSYWELTCNLIVKKLDNLNVLARLPLGAEKEFKWSILDASLKS